MSKGQVVTGVVAFSNLTKHDVYQGKDTGNYTLTITMDPAEASKLADQGIKIKDYEGKSQRKFKSQYKVEVLDLEGNPVDGEIPFGSTVRVLFVTGNPHPQFGTPVYMNKVRVVQSAAPEAPSEF